MNRVGATWLAGTLLLVACNSVANEPLPAAPNDPGFAKIGEKLNDEEKKLLAGYLIRREMAKSFGNQQLADGVTTIGGALDAQRKFIDSLTESQQKAEALKIEVEQKRKAVADQIAKTVTVAFVDAEFVPSSFEQGRYDDYEKLSFAVHNGGRKAIKALKGQAVFIDTFGDVFVTVPMQFEERVAAGEKKEIELGMEINKFMDEHKKVMSLDRTKKFRFEPDQIVYEDGSTLKAPASIS
jgi:hypothetical protein